MAYTPSLDILPTSKSGHTPSFTAMFKFCIQSLIFKDFLIRSAVSGKLRCLLTTLVLLCYPISIGTDRPEQTVDPDAASDQNLHCLPLIHQFLYTSAGSKYGLVYILGQDW